MCQMTGVTNFGTTPFFKKREYTMVVLASHTQEQLRQFQTLHENQHNFTVVC